MLLPWQPLVQGANSLARLDTHFHSSGVVCSGAMDVWCVWKWEKIWKLNSLRTGKAPSLITVNHQTKWAMADMPILTYWKGNGNIVPRWSLGIMWDIDGTMLILIEIRGDLSDQSSSSMSYMPDMMQTIWCCSEPAKGIQPERRMYTMTPTLHLGQIKRLKRLKRLGHSFSLAPKGWSSKTAAGRQITLGAVGLVQHLPRFFCFRWEVYPSSPRQRCPSWCLRGNVAQGAARCLHLGVGLPDFALEMAGKPPVFEGKIWRYESWMDMNGELFTARFG